MRRLRVMLLAAGLACAGHPAWAESAYDPLRLSADETPAPVDLTVHDTGRERDIPLRVYLPSSPAAAPVVLFSHGLGGSRVGSSFLGRHWAARAWLDGDGPRNVLEPPDRWQRK